jgi:2-hydroxycyclohexanecarboxyl-CoA dehydrogenase
MAFRGLKDQVALVTGGGSGIGRAISLRLAEEGCRLAVFDLNAAGAEESVRLAGGTAAAFAVDITDHAAVTAAVERVENEVGGIGILVNNAGWDRMMNFVDTDPTFWRKVIDINLVGHLNLHHAVLPRMVARRSGHVINIASDAGRVGSSGRRSTRPARAASSPSPRRWRARWRARASPSMPFAPAPPTRRCWRPPPATTSVARRCAPPWSAPSR